MKDWYGYKNEQGAFELYNLTDNPQQNKNIASVHPEITRRILEIMETEHIPSDVWPSPGETDEAFKKRIAQLVIGEHPNNVAEF